jgi:GT2 family glycosyltransferase
MQVSVVIPSLHSPIIDRTIASLEAQTYRDFEILVVGLDRHGLVPDGVRFLSTEEPVSPARARNLGIDAAQGDVICFIDADCEASPDWLERLLESHRQGGGVVGGAVDFPGERYWAVCDNVVAFHPYMRLSPAGERRYVPTISFCAARQALLEVGKLDERYPFPAGEDVDLCLRMSKQGHRIYFEPRAVVYHHHRRLRPRDTWARFVRYGMAWAQVRLQHEHPRGALQALFRAFVRHPWLMLALAPAIAPVNVVSDVLDSPRVFVKYWYTLPAFGLSNLAWAWGAVRSLRSARREREERSDRW